MCNLPGNWNNYLWVNIFQQCLIGAHHHQQPFLGLRERNVCYHCKVVILLRLLQKQLFFRCSPSKALVLYIPVIQVSWSKEGLGGSFIQLIGFTCGMMGWGGGRICSICCTTASKSTPSPSADHLTDDSVVARAPAGVNVIGERCAQVGEDWYS